MGRNILYHNNGNGTFTDVTEKAGVAAARLRPPLQATLTMTAMDAWTFLSPATWSGARQRARSVEGTTIPIARSGSFPAATNILYQ